MTLSVFPDGETTVNVEPSASTVKSGNFQMTPVSSPEDACAAIYFPSFNTLREGALE